jgi:hypothetical protein
MTASSGIPDPVDRQSKISCLGDRPLPVRLRLAEDRGYFPHLLPGKFPIKRFSECRRILPNRWLDAASIYLKSLEKNRSAGGGPHPYAGTRA